MDEKPYPTDEFDRPNGRNHQYRIPLDDSRALSKVRVADKIKGRSIVRNPSDIDMSEQQMGYVIYRTRDNKGPISGVGKYQYSQQWERPFGPGKWEGIEIRYNNGGGTKLKGPAWTMDEYGQEYRIEINTTVDLTVNEVKEAIDQCNDDYETLMIALDHGLIEAKDKEQQRKWEYQQQCDHKHLVVDDDLIGKVGYCEDCQREFEDEMELP